MCRDDLERFFEICRDEHFVIAQPSLLPSSFFSWSITLQRRWCCWRSTNFVEIMAPCFRGEDFVFFQSSFSENTSGWGLDYLWWWLAKQHGLGKFAVVDEIGMLHTRAVQSALLCQVEQSQIRELKKMRFMKNLTSEKKSHAHFHITHSH